jgi:hypothetical protein
VCPSLCVSVDVCADDGAIETLSKAIADSKGGKLVSPLRRICLDRNELTSKSAAVLSEVFGGSAARSSLVHLSLARNLIGDDGVVALGNRLLWWPDSSLLHIDLHGNAIGDAGATALAKILAALQDRCRVLTLDLSSNPKMTAASGAALAHLVSGPVLCRIDALHTCALTDCRCSVLWSLWSCRLS